MNKAGRPKKTLENLPQDWKETLLSLMREGASKFEVKAELGISNDLWTRLLKEEPEFSETVKRGEVLCQSWWERKGRENLFNHYQGDSFNSTLWYMNMKNRFGWKDKQEVEHSGDPLGVIVLPARNAN